MESLGIALKAYAGRQVLVTGHTGFKGGWLSHWLHHIGANVTGVALPPDTSPSLFEVAEIGSLVDHHIVNIEHADALQEIICKAKPEVVFHLAAQALVRRGYRAPLQTFASNVMGAANLLEAVRACPSVKVVVVVTSDKCYENKEGDRSFKESDPLGGHDPYSASKACAEIVTSAWRASYFGTEGMPLVASVRAGNVIGGGDWSEDRLIPDMLRAAESGMPLLIRNPKAIRPWQHVLEPLAGYLMLGSRLLSGAREFAEAWNFGPSLEDMQPVSALCDALCPQLGVSWVADSGEHPHEAPLLRLDSSKATHRLGWQPAWGLNEALGRVADWHRGFNEGQSASGLMSGQIADYVQAAEKLS